MPGKYTISQNGYDSSYESDGGTNFFPKETLGEGSNSRARKFQSLDGRELVVLNPRGVKRIDSLELFTKKYFFELNYPYGTTELFQGKENYRLITPLVPGVLYNKLIFNSPEQQLKVFLSAVRALKQLHEKGYIFIDLKEDNILYDNSTNESHLIDGGLITAKDQFVCPTTFKQKTKTNVQRKRKKYGHIAPECWSQTEEIANEAMDVYSLGNMMNRIIRANRDPHVANIIQRCQDPIIANRPNLYSLELWLQAILTIKTSETLFGNFSKLHTIKSVNEHKNNLLQTLNDLTEGNKLIVAYHTLSINYTDSNFTAFYQAKYKEITQLADQRIAQIRAPKKRKRERGKEKEEIQKSDTISSNQANDALLSSIFSKKQRIMQIYSKKSQDILTMISTSSKNNNDVPSTQAGKGTSDVIKGLLNGPTESLPEKVLPSSEKTSLATTSSSYRFFESTINEDKVSINSGIFLDNGLTQN
ncbi:MAG: hypothetical protein QM652_00160 [Legionella sp.]|uniref:protein kinase domain-containing protein n=1 Tax=Legionella sp. TaxID=459 RepID=UPI0039E325EF